MNPLSQETMRAAFDRDGFVRIPSIFSAEEIDDLRTAAHNAVSLTRTGQWPFFRSLPKQFPPWNDNVEQGIWGVQHLLHPDMPSRDTFANSYFGDAMVNAVTALLDCSTDQLVMELYNMLVRPDRDFALIWHRDDISPDVPSEEELQRLQEPILHTQWNLALYEDNSLIVVPGSHKRARTAVERDADPYEHDMPGQVALEMAPGDVVFYNNNILHRGIYDSKTERMTLHGSMGMVGSDPARARNILQHGIGTWASLCEFSGLPYGTAQLAEDMKQRLIALGCGESVGYSHQES